MGRLPIVSGAEVVKALGKLGFTKVSQKGSHVKLKNESGRVVIVPMHDELARGTLGSALDQAGVTEDAFKEAL